MPTITIEIHDNAEWDYKVPENTNICFKNKTENTETFSFTDNFLKKAGDYVNSMDLPKGNTSEVKLVAPEEIDSCTISGSDGCAKYGTITVTGGLGGGH